MKDSAQYQRDRQAAKKERGECLRCKLRAKDGSTLCVKCGRAKRKWHSEALAELRASGICVHCRKRKASVTGGKVRPSKPGRLCERCKGYFALTSRKRRAAIERRKR
jgi:hypothetical protein